MCHGVDHVAVFVMHVSWCGSSRGGCNSYKNIENEPKTGRFRSSNVKSECKETVPRDANICLV